MYCALYYIIFLWTTYCMSYKNKSRCGDDMHETECGASLVLSERIDFSTSAWINPAVGARLMDVLYVLLLRGTLRWLWPRAGPSALWAWRLEIKNKTKREKEIKTIKLSDLKPRSDILTNKLRSTEREERETDTSPSREKYLLYTLSTHVVGVKGPWFAAILQPVN